MQDPMLEIYRGTPRPVEITPTAPRGRVVGGTGNGTCPSFDQALKENQPSQTCSPNTGLNGK